MDTKKIESLIKLMKKHNLYEIEVEEDENRVRLVSSPSGSYTPTFASSVPQFGSAENTSAGLPAASSVSGKEIRSPFVGTYYESSSPGADPFVRSGQRVKKGDVLCIIEAMKIMNEIEAEFDCTIKNVLVSNEQPVEFDQPLFVFE